MVSSKHGNGINKLRGNGNAGHTYGTNLGQDEVEALLEYLKTL